MHAGVFHLANARRRSVAFVAMQMVLASVMGAAYGLRVAVTGSLLDALALHTLNNALSRFAFRDDDPTLTAAQRVPYVVWSLVLYSIIAVLASRELDDRLPCKRLHD